MIILSSVLRITCNNCYETCCKMLTLWGHLQTHSRNRRSVWLHLTMSGKDKSNNIPWMSKCLCQGFLWDARERRFINPITLRAETLGGGRRANIYRGRSRDLSHHRQVPQQPQPLHHGCGLPIYKRVVWREEMDPSSMHYSGIDLILFGSWGVRVIFIIDVYSWELGWIWMLQILKQTHKAHRTGVECR